MRNTVIPGDCLEVMPRIPAGSVDMILADLPYGTTRNRWDSVIPLEPLWEQYWRVLKPGGSVVLTAQYPFDKVLSVSAITHLRHEWVWIKEQGTGHLNAKRAPMKRHEVVLVFCKSAPLYIPQMGAGDAYTRTAAKRMSNNYGKHIDFDRKNTGERYPTTDLYFARDNPKLHPTQKPVALFEYLIRTYTNPGDLVLDNVAGSGTTAIAALNAGRDYLLIEKEAEYIEVINRRIDQWKAGEAEKSA